MRFAPQIKHLCEPPQRIEHIPGYHRRPPVCFLSQRIIVSLRPVQQYQTAYKLPSSHDFECKTHLHWLQANMAALKCLWAFQYFTFRISNTHSLVSSAYDMFRSRESSP